MASSSGEEKPKDGGTIQKLLLACDCFGLRCTMHTRNLKDFPTEFTERPSLSCCSNIAVNWKKLRLGFGIFWNIITAVCGLSIILCSVLLKYEQAPGPQQHCRYDSTVGNYPQRLCWYDLLERTVNVSWSPADRIVLIAGVLVLSLSLVNILYIVVRKSDTFIFTCLLLLFTILLGTGVGIQQMREMIRNESIKDYQENKIIEDLRNSISKIETHSGSFTHLQTVWNTIQNNCDCCGIYSSKDWKVVPNSCSSLARDRHCFGSENYYYNNRRPNNGTLPSKREGCVRFMFESMRNHVLYRSRDYAVAFIINLIIIGTMVMVRFLMIIPCLCIKRKQPQDKKPLLVLETDDEIIKP